VFLVENEYNDNTNNIKVITIFYIFRYIDTRQLVCPVSTVNNNRKYSITQPKVKLNFNHNCCLYGDTK